MKFPVTNHSIWHILHIINMARLSAFPARVSAIYFILLITQQFLETRGQCQFDQDRPKLMMERSSELFAPGYPNQYPSNSQCKWIIRLLSIFQTHKNRKIKKKYKKIALDKWFIHQYIYVITTNILCKWYRS